MHLVQVLSAGMNSYGGERPSNIHGAPVVWKDSANDLRLYVWGEEDFLRAFHFDGRRFQSAGRSTMRAPEKSMPGGMLALSSNGNAAESAIAWASVPLEGDANQETVPGIVRAFDAANVERELWNSEQESGRDRLGMFAKFCPPVVPTASFTWPHSPVLPRWKAGVAEQTRSIRLAKRRQLPACRDSIRLGPPCLGYRLPQLLPETKYSLSRTGCAQIVSRIGPTGLATHSSERPFGANRGTTTG